MTVDVVVDDEEARMVRARAFERDVVRNARVGNVVRDAADMMV